MIAVRRMSLRCLAAAAGVFLAAVAAVGQVSDFQYLPGDTARGPIPGSQGRPAIASGDPYSLAVWYDAVEVFGQRLDGAGNSVGSPFVIATDRLNGVLPRPAAKRPSVSWNGENWLVVFVGEVTVNFTTVDHILAVRVSPEGEVLDPDPIVVRSPQDQSNPPAEPAVAAGPGGEWAVVWAEYMNGNRIARGARISPAGVLLDATPRNLVTAASNIYVNRIHLAGDANGYLVAWQQYFGGTVDVGWVRANAQLQPLAGVARLGPQDAQTYASARIAHNGSAYMMIAQSSVGDLYAFRFPTSGPPTDLFGQYLTFTNVQPINAGFDVAWDGQHYVLVYDLATGFANEELRVLRVSTDGLAASSPMGIPGEPPDQVLYSLPAVSRLAGGGAGAHILWEDSAIGWQPSIMRSRVHHGATPEPRNVLTSDIASHSGGDFAEGPAGMRVVAYTSTRDDLSRVLAHRLDAAGNVIGAEPIQVAASPPPATAYSARVAFNGSYFMFTWVVGDRAYARRMSADGAFLDPAPVLVMPVSTAEVISIIAVDIEAVGDTFLVAAYTRRSFNRPYVNYVRINGSTMTVLDPEPRVLDFHVSSVWSFSAPRIAALGGRFFVTYTDFPAGDSRVEGAFVDLDGVATSVGTVGGASGRGPDIASDGSRALIVWQERPAGADHFDLFGRFVNAAGLEPQILHLISAPGDQSSVAVATEPSGDGYLMAWLDRRHLAVGAPGNPHIYGARITPAGSVLDPGGFAIDEQDRVKGSPAAASRHDGGFLVGYTLRPEDHPGVHRLGYRQVDTGGTPCPADYNGDGQVNSQDISAFITSWLESVQNGTLDADFNNDGFVNSSDISAFITAWLAAVQNGC